MKLIKLTSASDKKPVYINIECIGHIYEVPDKLVYNSIDKKAHTRVGVTTHNNGGFEIVENISQIVKLIEQVK